jgi:hypothetical protein
MAGRRRSASGAESHTQWANVGLVYTTGFALLHPTRRWGGF